MHRWTTGIALGILVALTLGACGSDSSSSGPATPTPSPTPNFEKTFTATALAGLVLQSTEGPSGLPYAFSGATTAADFWSCCSDVEAQWTSDGFVQLAGANFLAPTATGVDTTGWPVGVVQCFSFVASFRDSAAAHQALTQWRDHSAGTNLTSRAGPAELGPDAAELTGDPGFKPAAATQTYDYFWRVGNVVLNLQVIGKKGTFSESDARRLADTMNAHALK